MSQQTSYREMIEQEGCRVQFGDGQLIVSLKERRILKQKIDVYTRQNSPDVRLQAGPKKTQLKVHKEVLKEHIPYFKAMLFGNFQESSQTIIELGDDLDYQAVSKLITFAYKGTLQVAAADIQNLYEVADQWGMTKIANICTTFMVRELDASNCLDLLHLAQMHSCKEIIQPCLAMISQQFQAVSCTSSFIELPAQVLSSILQLEDINADEEFILAAVMRWYYHNSEAKQDKLSDVLHNIRMSFIPERVKKNLLEHPAIECLHDVKEVVRCKDREQERHYRQHFMVICGYLQSRTGPTCPRTSTVEMFDPNVDQFVPLKSLPEPPSYGAAFNLMGRVVFVAVYVEADPMLNRRQEKIIVWTYNSIVDSWKQSTELFSTEALGHILNCLVQGGTVVHCPLKNVIFAVLVDKSLLIDVQCIEGEIFCAKKAVLPSLQYKLDPTHCGLQGLAHNGQLYIMGGYYGPELEMVYSSTVLVLSKDGFQWESRADMLIPRSDFSLVSFENKIIVTGGYGGREQKRRLQSCEYYDVDLDQWQPLPPLKQSRSHHCSVMVNNKIYTIGGKSYASEKLSGKGGWHAGGARIVSDFVELMDPSLITSGSAAWERLARMTKSSCNFAAVVL